MKRIILTGASGYIGKNFISFIKNKKIRVIKLKTKKVTKIKNFPKNISHFIHLGFDMRKMNCDQKNQLNILNKIIKESKKKKFKIIFLSSSCYGKINNRKLFSNNTYQLVKQKCENDLLKNKDINYNILRVFNVYGPNQKKGNLIADAISKVKKQKSINIINGKSKRDFIHVKDISEAIYRTITNNASNGIYEIGSGKNYQIFSLFKMISKILNKSIKFKLKKPNYSKIKHTLSKIKKTNYKLKWKPKYDLEKGLKEIIYE